MQALAEHEHQWDLLSTVRDEQDQLVNQIFRCASCGDRMHDEREDHVVAEREINSSDWHQDGPPWMDQGEIELEAAWRE